MSNLHFIPNFDDQLLTNISVSLSFAFTANLNISKCWTKMVTMVKIIQKQIVDLNFY